MLKYEEQSPLSGEMISELSSHILRWIYHGNGSDIGLAVLLGSTAPFPRRRLQNQVEYLW